MGISDRIGKERAGERRPRHVSEPIPPMNSSALFESVPVSCVPRPTQAPWRSFFCCTQGTSFTQIRTPHCRKHMGPEGDCRAGAAEGPGRIDRRAG